MSGGRKQAAERKMPCVSLLSSYEYFPTLRCGVGVVGAPPTLVASWKSQTYQQAVGREMNPDMRTR